MGKKLGDPADPLLVSVRSGAKFSMPGMMDTVLNLGLNDESVEGLAKQTGDERFAYDSYRRFISMYGRIVLDIEGEEFDQLLDTAKEQDGVTDDAEVPADVLAPPVPAVQGRRREGTPASRSRRIPSTSSGARSRRCSRAGTAPAPSPTATRERIPHDLGTAVNVQTMVFGNRDDNSRHRRGLHPRTRPPARTRPTATSSSTPRARTWWPASATPSPRRARRSSSRRSTRSCWRSSPGSSGTTATCATPSSPSSRASSGCSRPRVGKRTGAAALRMAVDMTKQTGLEDHPATRRCSAVTADHLDQVLHPQFEDGDKKVLAKGLAASPGAAVGQRRTSPPTTPSTRPSAARRSSSCATRPHPRTCTACRWPRASSPRGGGLVSHAAVVARGWGKPAVVGAEAVKIVGNAVHRRRRHRARGRRDLARRHHRRGRARRHGAGRRRAARRVRHRSSAGPTRSGRASSAVRANADNGDDAQGAREFGAEGIGLCRTEHMFLGEDRLPIVRR